ncbi:MAG: malto-oligosyltrehalose trehalohydrolase [Betaproteobacteria bacterium]|nr:malto-oligosyltrehalose trehalohydrolase [Betaproteobacteria bacterium]
MKRRHSMPFGAEVNGGVGRFRLWAPSASQVALELSHARGRHVQPLTAENDGWYSATVSNIVEAAHYRYRIDDRISVPDPASRSNPQDVHGPSALVDPCRFEWPADEWRGRPWEEAVIYELHVGTFTPAGTFNAVIERLDYLVRLGVTAIELMPVSDFPGKRNWGYDGVLPFAPDASYGTPDDLKSLVVAAHARGLMMIMDVVYNHFGPEGNYLAAYAPQFFDESLHTPWGAAINFGGKHSRTVREFFIHNALYWLDEFNFDGLRLDAVHAIIDASEPDFMTELARRVRSGPGAARHVHLIFENDRNQAKYLRRLNGGRALIANAQWNDDFHHALHVATTGERDGYYSDFAGRPVWLLGRTLAEGFAFQGDPSPFRGGELRGEPSAHLPSGAFVSFTQSHDQAGNRALGDRIGHIAQPPALRLGVICLLLSPHVPMLFMGEEFSASSPFLFFCDFGPELADAVREGRRREFAAFERFADPAAQLEIPDPNADSTFEKSKLNWDEVAAPACAEWHTLYSDLLEIRRKRIVPHLDGPVKATFAVDGGRLAVDWRCRDGASLHLRANFSDEPWRSPALAGDIVFASEGATPDVVPGWGGVWAVERGERTHG